MRFVSSCKKPCLFFHKWDIILNTGITKYKECKKCGLRMIDQQDSSVYQPVVPSFLRTGVVDDIDIMPPPNEDSESVPETQENWSKPHDGQEEVTLDGKTFWADKELIPLLTAMNEAGLKTRSHCAGHSDDMPSWVAIRYDNISDLEIRTYGAYSELLLTWWPDNRNPSAELKPNGKQGND